MASGFSLSDMATEGGCGLKVAVGGGAGRGRGSACSTAASWATEAVGVMGDTGGRSGEADSVEASLDEAGRAFVSTRSAGMAAWCRVVSRREPESLAEGNRRRRLSNAGRGAQRPESCAGKSPAMGSPGCGGD